MKIETILNELLEIKEKSLEDFMEKYQNLPLYIYEEIEALSYSKTKRTVGQKAKKITKTFHKNFIEK